MVRADTNIHVREGSCRRIDSSWTVGRTVAVKELEMTEALPSSVGVDVIPPRRDRHAVHPDIRTAEVERVVDIVTCSHNHR